MFFLGRDVKNTGIFSFILIVIAEDSSWCIFSYILMGEFETFVSFLHLLSMRNIEWGGGTSFFEWSGWCWSAACHRCPQMMLTLLWYRCGHTFGGS